MEWDGMECIEIGMKQDRDWNRPLSVFNQVQVRGMSWPLVQQSLSSVHRAWQRQAEILRTATSSRDDKKSDFPFPILTSCLQSVIAPKRIDRF